MQNTVKIEVTTWLLYTLAHDIFLFFSLNRLKLAKKRLRTPDKIKIYRSRNVSPCRRSAEILTTRRVRSAERMSFFVSFLYLLMHLPICICRHMGTILLI